MTLDLDNRRPIKSRGAGWAQGGAAWLARKGVSPDAVSAGAIVFSVIGCAAFIGSGVTQGFARGGQLLVAAFCVQGRLVCNLLDGMVAVEHGRGGPSGPIWNELPDRIADVLFFVGAGYGAALAGVPWAIPAGWLAAVLAVTTAYVRELGRGLSFPADFGGPGAKPQRMAILTAAAIVAIAEPVWGWLGQTLSAALALIAGLAAWTAATRVQRLAARLKAKIEGPSP